MHPAVTGDRVDRTADDVGTDIDFSMLKPHRASNIIDIEPRTRERASLVPGQRANDKDFLAEFVEHESPG